MNAISETLCVHCRTPFRPTPQRTEFCCPGCQFVSHLLHKRGFEEFYNYGDRKSPAGNFVFHERDLAWLDEIREQAESSETESAVATLDIQGISCAGCVWLLERVFLEHPGAISCRVNSTNGTIRLEWISGKCDLAAYAEDVRKFGYLLGPAATQSASTTRPLARRLGLCGALAMNAMIFALPRYLGLHPGDALSGLFDVISLGLATASIVVGGGYFFRRAAMALRSGMLHIDLPISLGLIAAYVGSCVAWVNQMPSFAYFDFVSIFTFLMLLGRWLQERALESNRRRLLAMKLGPGTVQRYRDDVREEISAVDLLIGDVFGVGKGRMVPVRSRLVADFAVFALNGITGEPTPREFFRGGIVPAGARNLSSEAIECESLEVWQTSQLAALMNVESGMTWRNQAMQRLISVYLSIVLTVAVIGFAAWGIGSGDWIRATQVLVSVLVVSCPCAIGVALPLLDDIAAARLQRSGIYIREGSLWPRLRHVTNILFDKTGTITLETLALANADVLTGLALHEKSVLLRLVRSSLHPVAACLREALLPIGVEPASGKGQVVEVVGAGLEWITPEGTWRLGRSHWAGGKSGGTTAFVFDGRELAAFTFREEFRPGAAAEMAALRDAGYAISLLSGDESARVGRMAGELGIDPAHAFGDLSPTGKADLVRSRWSGNSLMIGDGANDSLAIDAALCSGTPSIDTGLLEHKADFYMPGSSLNGLQMLFRASRMHHLTTSAVFAFAITYNAVAVTASLAGFMNPLVAAIIMPLSSLASIGIVLIGFQPNPNHSNYGNQKP